MQLTKTYFITHYDSFLHFLLDYPIQSFLTWLVIMIVSHTFWWKMNDSCGDNKIEDLEHDESSSSLKRSRTSTVWDQFDHIVDDYGTPKARCKIYEIKNVNRLGSNTFNMKCHLEKCPLQENKKEKSYPFH